MRKVLITILALSFIIASGIILPKLLIKDNENLSIEDISYGWNVTRQILSNPIEKFLITKIVATEKEGNVITTEAYIFGGIKWAITRVNYDKGAKVIWRRWIGPESVDFASDSSQSVKHEKLKVKWHPAKQIEDLELINNLEKDQYVKYFEVGKITSDGEYRDGTIILAEFFINNLYDPENSLFYRLIRKTSGEYISLPQYSANLDEEDGLYELTQKFDTTKTIVNKKIIIEGLDFPKEINDKDDNQILKLDEFSIGTSEYFDAKNLEIMFTDSQIGEVYYCSKYHERDNAWASSPVRFYVKSPDGIEIRYELKSDFINNQNDQLNSITWLDGSSTERMMYRFDPPPCGSRGHIEIIENNPITLDDLEEAGETSSGEKIYELKDKNHSVLKRIYEDTKPTYEITVNEMDAPENWIDQQEQKFYDELEKHPISLSDLKYVGENEYSLTVYTFTKEHPAQQYLFEGAELMLMSGNDIGSIKVSYDDFVDGHQLIFWKDPFDRLIRLRSSAFILACGGKPAIYLYPEEKTEVSVKVDLAGDFLKTIPEHGDKWKVTAEPSGKIVNKKDNKEYPYLFWEGPLASHKRPNKGFVVKKSDIHSFLSKTLRKIGLSKQEIFDFQEFWEPKMKEAPYYFITFSFNEDLEKLAPLEITPKPDTVIRVLMDYIPLEEFQEVAKLEIPINKREGFTLVEWGGVMP